MPTTHEDAFVSAFIVPEKRERYRSLLGNPKRRRTILRELYHRLPFRPERATELKGAAHFAEPLEALLRGKGAGDTCYLISPDEALDGRETPLREALDALVGGDGAGVACCVAGRLAVWKGEGECWVLERG